MRTLIALAVFAFVSGQALAADKEAKTPSPAQQAQREKMKACNADAKKQLIKGEDRKKFMSECLKGEKS